MWIVAQVGDLGVTTPDQVLGCSLGTAVVVATNHIDWYVCRHFVVEQNEGRAMVQLGTQRSEVPARGHHDEPVDSAVDQGLNQAVLLDPRQQRAR